MSSTLVAAQVSTSGANGSERICRTTPVTGSRIAHRRVCKTQAEWDEADRITRESLAGAQTRQVNLNVDEKLGRQSNAGPPR